jgi:hypothetical protein
MEGYEGSRMPLAQCIGAGHKLLPDRSEALGTGWRAVEGGGGEGRGWEFRGEDAVWLEMGLGRIPMSIVTGLHGVFKVS